MITYGLKERLESLSKEEREIVSNLIFISTYIYRLTWLKSDESRIRSINKLKEYYNKVKNHSKIMWKNLLKFVFQSDKKYNKIIEGLEKYVPNFKKSK